MPLAMAFDKDKKGRNVDLSNHGATATRISKENGFNGVVVTKQPLEPGRLFKIKVVENYTQGWTDGLVREDWSRPSFILFSLLPRKKKLNTWD